MKREGRELTPTDSTWKFSTELVDHLPASATVPTPLTVLGYVPGTIARLAYVDELNRYFRAVERTSTAAERIASATAELAIALVRESDVDVVDNAVTEAFERAGLRLPRVFVAVPSRGAGRDDPVMGRASE